MKKVLFAVAIVSATFVACNGSEGEKGKDTTIVTPPVVIDTPVVTPVIVDSPKMEAPKVDSPKMEPKK